MTPKRKANDALLPAEVHMKPKDGNAPFAVYFPSGFKPDMPGAGTTFETYAQEKRKNQYAVVAKTVITCYI